MSECPKHIHYQLQESHPWLKSFDVSCASYSVTNRFLIEWWPKTPMELLQQKILELTAFPGHQLLFNPPLFSYHQSGLHETCLLSFKSHAVLLNQILEDLASNAPQFRTDALILFRVISRPNWHRWFAYEYLFPCFVVAAKPELCCLKCGSQTSSKGILWEVVGNAEFQDSPLTYWTESAL